MNFINLTHFPYHRDTDEEDQSTFTALNRDNRQAQQIII